MANTGSWIDVRPSADLARRYRELGFWREVTPAADLWRWAWETPDAVAITAHRVGSGIQRMTYREYADQVDRVTTVLGELGIGPGNVVTAQLPNWWQLNAVVLACARLGAIVAPVVTTVRGPELELQMARLKPVAYVTTETWDGYPHSAVLASIADRLPSVQHRVIVGGRVAPGEIDFERRVEEADAAGPGTDCPAEDPDRISMVLFTSGTTGTPKAVLHSFNTFYAPCRSVALGNGLSSADVLYTPHALGHVLAQHVANMLPLYLGAQGVFADTWVPSAPSGCSPGTGSPTRSARPSTSRRSPGPPGARTSGRRACAGSAPPPRLSPPDWSARSATI
jgi:cyclohexanecarboxylate-CoA ligase